MIKGIQEAVTIPVMAKARIGHFAEAQVLEALEVDYIDESEVLTPADEANHIDKWAFKIPFVCGATNLGEALRPHRRGRGDDPLQGRGRHRRHRRGRAPPAPHPREISGSARSTRWSSLTGAKEQQSPLDLVRGVAAGRQAAGAAVLRRAASPRRPTRRWSCSSAPRACSSARASSSPRTRDARAAIVEATTHFRDARAWASAPRVSAPRCRASSAQARRDAAARRAGW
jgi:pyridoxal 5'-phosphate synthase pdxS subunit